MIKVTLEFINGKGVLGFSRNEEILGNICDDIEPPVYPVVALAGVLARVSLIN